MAGNGFNKSRIFGIVVESGTEFLEDYIQTAIEVDEGPIWPELGTQLLAADDFTWAVEQNQQNTEGLVLKLNAHAIAGQRLVSRVRLKQAESEAARRGSGNVHR